MADWDVTQDGQIARITTALGKDGAFLESFTVTEALGEPFRIACDVVCPQPYSFMEHRGTGLSLEVAGEALVARAFHGVLTEAALLESIQGGWRVQLVARPWFWVLSLGRNSRIFQAKSARDIIKQVFDDAGVSTSQYSFAGLTSRGTIVRDYCVQFEESDFTFVSRLMEEEGIYYYFAHTADQHVMNLCDGKAAHADFGGGDVVVREDTSGLLAEAHLTSLTRRIRPTLAEYATRDQHPLLFGDMRDAKAAAAEVTGMITAKVFEYPGWFSYLTADGTTTGDDVSGLRLDADLADAFVHVGYGGVFAVPVGSTINLAWNKLKPKMLVNGATHRFSGQNFAAREESRSVDATVEIECVSYDQVWRPRRRTPKPSARGVQVATVVGVAGEEVDVDSLGRVRVQFPWDRLGTSDDKSSCWIRSSSSWAGPGSGEFFLPRVGHEVIVDFIDGDMDRPIITGRVYNSKNSVYATKTDADLALPGGKNRSGWVTRTTYGKSTLDYDGAVDPPTEEPGYNALVFDDKSGVEMVTFRAQRDMTSHVYRDLTARVHRSSKEFVGKDLTYEVQTGDEIHKVTLGKRTTTINKDETLTVELGAMSTTVSKGDQSNTVSEGAQTTTISKGDQTVTVTKGNRTVDVTGGNISVKAAAGSITVEAMQSIELKVGGNSVKLDQSGITIKGTMVSSEASTMNTVKGSATVVVQGGIVNIN